MEAAEESIQKRAVLYDRDGDYHFDTISAFIKSVRGSDPDAALYWLAKMVRAGEDPSFIFRRMIILASEDVGLADPHALEVVISCAEAFDRIGFPEGNFPLAHACLYLATAPKSNTTLAFFDALKEVDKEDAEVPNHLRDASRDAEGFGHGEGYVYPHAYRDHWAAQQYLPDALRGRSFYLPSIMGYEGKIREEVLRKREVQASIVLEDGPDGINSGGEFLTWSASSKGREGWFKRLESGRSRLLLSDRDAIFAAAAPLRHDRILIPLANDGLLLWEGLRRTPEGLCAALTDSEAAREALLRYAANLGEIEQPEIAVHTASLLPGPETCAGLFSAGQFDHILIREPWRRGFGKYTKDDASPSPETAFSSLARDSRQLLAPGGDLVLLCSPPPLGERISRILSGKSAEAKEDKNKEDVDLLQRLKESEDAFFTTVSGKQGIWNWDEKTAEKSFSAAGFTVTLTSIEQSEERLVTERDLSAWFDKEKSRWGAFIFKNLGNADFSRIETLLRERIKNGPIVWKWKSFLLKAVIHQ
jgi:putative ATPase